MKVRLWLATPILLAGLLGAQPSGAQGPETAERAPAQTQQTYPDNRRDWHWRMMQDGWHSGFGYGHWVFSLLFWTLIVGALVLGIRAASSSKGERRRPRSALDVLNERYARGEIGREEYLRCRHDLESSDRA